MGNKLSIVIQSHQPTLLLGRCLNSLMEQQCSEELEVIVVDHRARRSVHQLIRWWNLSLARLGRRSRIVHLPLRNATPNADRLGLRTCTGSLVAFLDETAIPSADWAARAVAELQLRESHPPDIMPPLDARGVVQRRSALLSAMTIDDRAVLSAHGATADSFSLDEEPRQSFGSRHAAHRIATVTPTERPLRTRVAPIEDYVCLIAVVVAVTAGLMQNFAVALFATVVWLLLTVVAARSGTKGKLLNAVVRPFTNVWRGTQIIRSPR